LYVALSTFQEKHPHVTFATILRDKLSVPQEPVSSSDAWYASGAFACDAVFRRAGVAGLGALADVPNDAASAERVLAGLLGIADEPDALNRWWRTAARSSSRPEE
jgi:hypothetical protein